MKKLVLSLTLPLILFALSFNSYATDCHWFGTCPEPEENTHYTVTGEQEQHQSIEEGAVVVNSNPSSNSTSSAVIEEGAIQTNNMAVSGSTSGSKSNAVVNAPINLSTRNLNNNVQWDAVQPLNVTASQNSIGSTSVSGTSLSIFAIRQETDFGFGGPESSNVIGASINIPMGGGQGISKRALTLEYRYLELRNILAQQNLVHSQQDQEAKNIDRCVQEFHLYAQKTTKPIIGSPSLVMKDEKSYIVYTEEHEGEAIWFACTPWTHSEPNGDAHGNVSKHNQHFSEDQLSGHSNREKDSVLHSNEVK